MTQTPEDPIATLVKSQLPGSKPPNLPNDKNNDNDNRTAIPG